LKKLLILDSNSIINRAFYGVRYLSTSDGTPTNAVYGFMNILLKLISEEKPDYLCAAFDVKAPTFRHEMYKDYKAQRKPMPDGLKVQMPIAKEIISAMNIPILEIAGYEADDIIGTVSRICEENDVKCMVATGDKDDLQLASEKTNIILTVSKQGVSDTVIYDDKAVVEKYGVTPTEFIDVKALMGDASDNIPGVAGIGEKTALKLITEFKSIEKLYENLETSGLKGATLRKIEEGRDSAFFSKVLATINRNVPIDFDFESCRFSEDYNRDELSKVMTRLELFSILKRIGIEKVKENVDFFLDMKTVKTEDTDLVFSAVKKAKRVAVVPEVVGKKICGAVVCVDDTVYSVDTGDIQGLISNIFMCDDIEKIVFDIKDTIVSMWDKIGDSKRVLDCAIAGYLLNPQKTYTIESICAEYLKADISAEESGSAQLSLLDEEQISVLPKQAYALLRLWDILSDKMEKNSQHELFYDIEMPLVYVLASMQVYGFRVDKAMLSEFGKMLDLRIGELTEQIYSLTGEKFNINSPKQLGEILFEKMGLTAPKKTKNGYSTSAEVLEKIMNESPVIPLILEYRSYTKLKSTYCDGLSAVISEKTGKIHSVFNQTVTATGRISSTEPNMQNIPVRTELGREIRKMFVASDDEHILIDADYSQIELRVLAHYAEDENMTDAFLSESDIHAVTASQVFGVPLSEVTDDQRRSAKAVNFGIVYGIGEFSLAGDLKIPIKVAKQYIDSYLEKYSGVKNYMKNIKTQAKEDGYVKTLMNRVRYIPELKSPNYNIRSFGERVALNTPIQGTAADIIKLAMVKVYDRLRLEGLKSKLILQVHDELIIDACVSEKDKVCAILKEEMEGAMKLRVPLVADMNSGKSWYDAK